MQVTHVTNENDLISYNDVMTSSNNAWFKTLERSDDDKPPNYKEVYKFTRKIFVRSISESNNILRNNNNNN